MPARASNYREQRQDRIEGPFAEYGPRHAGENQSRPLIAVDLWLVWENAQRKPLGHGDENRCKGLPKLEIGPVRHHEQHQHDHQYIHRSDAKDAPEIQRPPVGAAARIKQFSPEQETGNHEEDTDPDLSQQRIESRRRIIPGAALQVAMRDDEVMDEHAQREKAAQTVERFGPHAAPRARVVDKLEGRQPAACDRNDEHQYKVRPDSIESHTGSTSNA